MIRCSCADELLKILYSKKIIVYGIGHVAMNFFYALEKKQLSGQITQFVVSEVKGSEKTIVGVPVRGINDVLLEDDTVLCIAVHQALMEEIIGNVEKKGFLEYVWVYPFLYDLLLGSPLKTDEKIELRKILSTCSEDYRVAIRKLAIHQYFGRNAFGYDFYKRAQAIHCSSETAEKRLKIFCDLIENWNMNGYDSNSKVLLNTDFEIIDGNHRVALAYYFGQREIICDVYSNEISVTKLHGEGAMLTREALVMSGFKEDEISKLDEIKNAVTNEVIYPVSIIIPVYNVIEWLDVCLESVVSQTFKDFEVILINDGSTDGSGRRCVEWVEKDSRFKLVDKINEGPSIARNIGMLKAKGNYFVFLDADDWLDETFLEKMYQRALDTGADIVECDVYRVNHATGEKTYRVCSGIMGRPYTLEEHMKYGYTAIWKCMFRRELFKENGIEFPNCHSEARAVYALLLAVSKRIENVPEALYYYRILREGSLSSKPRNNQEAEDVVGLNAFDNLFAGFKRLGIYQNYERLLQVITKTKLSDLLAGYFYRWDEEAYKSLTKQYYRYIKTHFPESKNDIYMNLGGYNLNRILWHMNMLHNPYCRFNFSSIISIMNPVNKINEMGHKNRYRGIMLNREMKNSFWKILNEVRPNYLFMDFIEERFDVIPYNGGYLTRSDAFKGSGTKLGYTKIISRDSEECKRLWEISCLNFIRVFETEYPEIEIVLIKNYLSERVGDIYLQEEYGEIEQIQKLNCILKGYYGFFEKHCKKVMVIEAAECPFYFTDKQYEYGAVPSHLNEIVNEEIANKIEAGIGI